MTATPTLPPAARESDDQLIAEANERYFDGLRKEPRWNVPAKEWHDRMLQKELADRP